MTFTVTGDIAVLEAISGAEDATELADWLENEAEAKIDLHDCTHLHAAVLQTLMAYQPLIVAPSIDPFLAQWIMPCLTLAQGAER